MEQILLYILLGLEVVLRVVLEVRERRLTQVRGGVFAVLRLVPLLNDIVPLPESRKAPAASAFVEKHEEGHKSLHHGILRSVTKIIFLIVAVWFLAAMLSRFGLTIYESVLWLHLAAIPLRMIFHLYCWNQEYEADAYAMKQLGKAKAKEAMRDLVASEIPYTKLFAVVYREHPTATLRQRRLFAK